MRGRYASYQVRLSNGGVSATGRLLRPGRETSSRSYPAVLLQNGRELNSRAIDFLPADFGDVVVLSLDYPEEVPHELRVAEILLQSAELRRTLRRIAPTFSLGADYLASRGDTDSARLALVATSFAVPFAVHAAAADRRFVNVGLIYGAGEMADVLAANLTMRPRWLRSAAAWIAMRPYAEFSPERYVGRIAPRPIIMVNGIDDPQMPRSAVQALYDAARPPKDLIWLRTGHLMPDDTVLVRALVDTTLARLPVLKGAAVDRAAPESGSFSTRPRPIRGKELATSEHAARDLVEGHVHLPGGARFPMRQPPARGLDHRAGEHARHERDVSLHRRHRAADAPFDRAGREAHRELPHLLHVTRPRQRKKDRARLGDVLQQLREWKQPLVARLVEHPFE
jgi:hypothetical protein